MKKALKKLIPTIIMVLIAASMVGTSTFAWFSMNSKVTVTGMTVTTKVSNNLSIADTNHVESPAVVDKQYDNLLSQTRTGELRPTSTVNGIDFFYTNPTNVNGNGDAKSETYIAYSEAGVEAGSNPVDDNIANDANYLNNTNAGKTHYDASFNTTNGMTTTPVTTSNVLYGYIDYTFYIKATNVDTSNATLNLTTCNLLYNGGLVGEDAWRVAVFSKKTTVNTNYDTDWTTSERVAMLKMSSSGNFEDGKAVATTGATGAVTYTSDTSWQVATVTGKETEYFKVTVRLWLEGEDTDCNNETFATLTQNYTLNLGFELNGTSVQYLNSALVGATATAADTASVTLSENRLTNGQVALSYQWYNASDDTEVSSGEGGTTKTYKAAASGSYYCIVTTNHTGNNTYRTQTVELTVTP